MAEEAIELDKDGFMRLVTEEHLQVEGPSGGYLYTGRKGKRGWELYKTANNPWWLYQGRRINTQGVAGPNALQTNIAVPDGCIAKLVGGQVVGTASAGATLVGYVYDEDGAILMKLCANAAAANSVAHFPQIGTTSTAATTSNNVANSVGLLLGPGMYIGFISSVSIAAETLSVGISLLMSQKVEPTWNTTGSGGTPTLADSTISEANTFLMVPMP